MIDNHHLVYGGVILLYLMCAMIIAVFGMIFLTAGFAVSLAVRFRKRHTRRKRLEAATPVPVEAAAPVPAPVEDGEPVEEDDVFPPVSLGENVGHLYEVTDGHGRGKRRADLSPVMNSVSL